MNQAEIGIFFQKSKTPQAVEENIEYLTQKMSQFLFRGERVLLCFHHHEYGNISYLMERAVLHCGAEPVLCNKDMRWINLLRLAFTTKAEAIIGSPMVVLGLAKLAKVQGVPLYIRDAVIAGYPAAAWFKAGIAQGLDCEVWECFNLWLSGVVCGFSCSAGNGIHIWDERYGVDVVDRDGSSLPVGEKGECVVYRRAEPDIRFPIGENCRLAAGSCGCENTGTRIVDLTPGRWRELAELELGQSLQSWSSILDCRMNKGECGMELEIVYFPGERLPKLPTVAKLVLRPWNPEEDEPFWFIPFREYSEFF